MFSNRRIVLSIFLSFILCACGGSGASNNEADATTEIPSNNIAYSFFRDKNDAKGLISGNLVVKLTEFDDVALNASVWGYWADSFGNTIGESWLKASADVASITTTLNNVTIPDGAVQILLVYVNDQTKQAHLIPFHDFIGNAALSGPGGNEQTSWYYGEDRVNIRIHRQANGLCVFDNGLVSVIDMNNELDPAHGSSDDRPYDDVAFPPFDFMCGPEPVNTERAKVDEVGVWTYSTLNDAMFYGTVVYDTFNKYLGEPPLEEKIRLRVHYGHELDQWVFWDGAYANFSDAYLTHYSTATLDFIAHEVAHGVLGRISALKVFGVELSDDARTLHEAFGDLSGVMAKYEFTGLKSWVHGEESNGDVRYLDRIITEPGAIPSYLDYDEAGKNYYRRIGMMTYPFYVLADKWGIAKTFMVYLNSAKHCWQPSTTLLEAARCIQQQAELAGLPVVDVINAFKSVKIQLFEEGVLSHFLSTKKGLSFVFSDDSRSTSAVTHWLWDFGDGSSSAATNPTHVYADKGSYKVVLTVTDQSGDQDTYARMISVL